MSWSSPDCGFIFACVALIAASSEIFSTGSGLKRRVLMMVKTAVFAPMPSARVSAATAEKPGVLRSMRSEEHTSELQSQSNLVCRLLLEKKKKIIKIEINVVDKYT